WRTNGKPSPARPTPRRTQAFLSKGCPGELNSRRCSLAAMRVRSASEEAAACRFLSLATFSLRVRRRRISGRRLGADISAPHLWIDNQSIIWGSRGRVTSTRGTRRGSSGELSLPGRTEPADEQSVSIRAVEAEHIDGRFPLGRIDDLTNAQQGSAARDRAEFRSPRVRGGGIHFFVGMGQFYAVVVFQGGKQRIASQAGGNQTAEFF